MPNSKTLVLTKDEIESSDLEAKAAMLSLNTPKFNGTSWVVGHKGTMFLLPNSIYYGHSSLKNGLTRDMTIIIISPRASGELILKVDKLVPAEKLYIYGVMSCITTLFSKVAASKEPEPELTEDDIDAMDLDF